VRELDRKRKRALLRVPLLLAASLAPAATGPQYLITSVAGSDAVGDGGAAVAAQLAGAEGVAADAAGNVYLADAIDHRVRKVSPAGVITTVAGNGHPGFQGDEGPARNALLNSPYGLAVDAAGTLYIADLGNGRVRAVSPDGLIRTVAGGQSRPGGDGGDALAAKLSPRNVAVAPDGALYISDFADHRIYRVTRDGRISVVAGTGVAGAGEADEPVSTAQLNAPAGLAVDPAGALWVADSGNNRVCKIDRGRLVTVVPSSLLSAPTGVAVDAAGNLYIADSGNRRVARRSPAGVTTTLAGFGELAPRDLATDRLGGLYVAARTRVFRLSAAGQVAAFAGDGTFGFRGDGGPALEAHLFYPAAVAADAGGNLYIADQRNYRVRKVEAGGRILTVAGTGVSGSTGDGGPAVLARLTTPAGVALDAMGRLWIADQDAHRVRLAAPGGIIETVAGTGVRGFQGDGGPASGAQLSAPAGVAVDRAGNAYLADSLNHRVRKIAPDGRISTVAGRGVRGYGGDGGPAIDAQMDTPRAVAVDAEGNLYVAEYANHCVRRVTAGGRIETVAGTGRRGYSGDGGPAVAADLNHPLGVALDAAGNLFIADADNHRVRLVSPAGVITTVAGTGNPGFAGDGGPAALAELYFPSGLAAGPDGAIFIADFWNHRVRKLTPLVAAPVEAEPEPLVPLRVLHAASLASGPVAPGQLVAILGAGLAAAPGATEVRFDGAPAPVLYAQDNLVNTRVPTRLAAQTEIEVWVRGVQRGRAAVPMAAAVPGLFTVSQGQGQALAVHEDGSLNTEANPAPRGSVVVLYATGEGISNLPVAVSVAGFPAQVLYAGEAPGYPGLMQLNVRLPSAYAPPGVLPVTLTVGPAASQSGVTIALK
jgi:uncharacterized protein (TIGR03437 family)